MLSALDLIAIVAYFLILLGIGVRVMRSASGEREIESFLAADRDMGLAQTTASTAATDLGGGFSIAMGGLGRHQREATAGLVLFHIPRVVHIHCCDATDRRRAR